MLLKSAYKTTHRRRVLFRLKLFWTIVFLIILLLGTVKDTTFHEWEEHAIANLLYIKQELQYQREIVLRKIE